MPVPTPIQITLYDDNNEVLRECKTVIVRWRILKKAIALTKLPGFKDTSQLDEADIDAVGELVRDVFPGQVTLKELDDHADLGDMMSVVNSIVARAHGIIEANPTPPPSKKK